MAQHDGERRVVPIDEAIKRIGKKKYIHTFMSGGVAIIGADHDQADLITAMSTHGVEESGEMACSMGHTLVIVNYPTFSGVTPLFIEAKPREKPRSEDAGATTVAVGAPESA